VSGARCRRRNRKKKEPGLVQRIRKGCLGGCTKKDKKGKQEVRGERWGSKPRAAYLAKGFEHP